MYKALNIVWDAVNMEATYFEEVVGEVVEKVPRRQHLVVPLEPLDGRLRVPVHDAGQVNAVAQECQRLRILHPHLWLDCVGGTKKEEQLH